MSEHEEVAHTHTQRSVKTGPTTEIWTNSCSSASCFSSFSFWSWRSFCRICWLNSLAESFTFSIHSPKYLDSPSTEGSSRTRQTSGKWVQAFQNTSSTFERIRKHFWFNPNRSFLSLNQKTGHFFPRHRTCSFVLNMKSFNSCGRPLRRAKTPRSRSDIPDQTLDTNFQVAWEDAKWSSDFQVDLWWWFDDIYHLNWWYGRFSTMLIATAFLVQSVW